MSPTLLVLAAGMGSRYGGLKQIDPMGPHGETLLDYSVFDAYRAGFGRVVFVIRPDFEEEFKAKVGDRFQSLLPVQYAFQSIHDLPKGFSTPPDRRKPWGTGHAVLCAAEVVQDNFCVINADDFYGREAYARISQHLTTPPTEPSELLRGCMVGYRLKQTLSTHGSVSRGVCQQDETGALLSVQEMTKIFATASGGENRVEGEPPIPLPGDKIVSLNFWGFTPSIFKELESLFGSFLQEHEKSLTNEFYLPFAIDHLVVKKKLTIDVLSTESPWFGVTYREDKAMVQQSLLHLIQAGEYPESLFNRTETVGQA